MTLKVLHSLRGPGVIRVEYVKSWGPGRGGTLKAMIAKRATECGVTNTVRYFSHKFVDKPLCEGTIRTWVKQYKRELISRRECNKDANIEKLESKRRGRPLLLGDELDKRVQLCM